jgi:hypothetical protein
LTEHPEIFMAKKEQHYFGSDLASFWPQPTAEQYFASFAGSEGARRRGEASGWYLLSERAAAEIHTYRPDARIIAMFRNPVEMLPSLHSQFLYDEFEELSDFSEALAAEEDRRRGERIPVSAREDVRRLLYRDLVRFDEQLLRYLERFGPDRVHVILFDDLVRDPGRTYAEVAEFLGVDATCVPAFRVMNPQKRIRSRGVQHLISQIVDDSSLIRRIGARVIPVHSARSALLGHGVPALDRINTSYAAREPGEPALRRELANAARGSVGRLGELLDRDLSHWCEV